MSKKRFTVQQRCVVDATNNETFEFSFQADAEIICEKLNKIAEENERLKSDDAIRDLECEIVMLKDDSNYYQIKSGKCEEELLYLRRENKKLKQTMHEVYELLVEEVDLFSDKAVEHDINAYVELRDFDNKDAYYMASATKTCIKKLKEFIK